ncbi:MAG: TldD/PmbA family protein [Armatimonadetes bacterium]|nr:TldD/PmbA family protein [Armatimonadota bacterium]
MIGKEAALRILMDALSHAGGTAQVALSSGESGLTRYANSVIHQNVSERNVGLSVRAVVGKKIGYARTNSLEKEAVKATVEKAFRFASFQQENPDFVSLPGPRPVPEAEDFSEETASVTPERRADLAGKVLALARKSSVGAAGALSTGYGEYAVANSLGIAAYHRSASAHMSLVGIAEDGGFGYADRMASDIARIDADGLAEEGVRRALDSRNPADIAPGEYDVVLLPYAAADLLEFLGYLGFSALAVQEERSFLCGKFGRKVCGDNITIWDDGLDSRGRITPFDPEGVPKQRVDLITRGVAQACVYDSYTAYKEGKESTGHGSGGAGTWGPYPGNMLLEPGSATVEEMIASTGEGLLVTRFHYTNVIHPIQTIITGMTRDGTFRIENGKIAGPVRNLRFTESALGALSRVETIGRDMKLQGSACVPALKIKGFRFTGATEF